MALRRQMAVDLRLQGGSYRLIAETMRGQQGVSASYSEGAAHGDVQTELDRVKGHMLDSADRIKTRQLLQIQEMFAAVYPYAKQGDVASLDRCMKLLHYEAELLGLFPQAEKAQPRGAGGGTMTTITDNATTLTIREVVVQLNGVDGESVADMLDVTPTLEDNHDNRGIAEHETKKPA